ncbi:MAG: hypothetical protein WAM30_19555 [Candidatus Dormiibacterota bacterium]
MAQMNRRQMLRYGGVALGAGASLPWLLEACGGSASGSSLKLFNDKVAWKPWFVTEGNAAKKATGSGWAPTEFADTNTYQAQIRTVGSTTKVPDLFTWWSGWLLKDLVNAGFPDDVGSLWDKEGDVWRAGLRDAFTFNGKTYAAPLNFAYWVTLYSKPTFAKYNLQPPKTWADLENVLQTLKSNGVQPLGATIDGRWPAFIYFQELLIRTDPTLYQNLMAGKAKYTDPGVVQAMTKWGDWIRAGYFTDPNAVTFGTGSNTYANSFVQGKSAMVQIATWYEPTLTGAGVKPDDIGAFVWPNMPGNNAASMIFETGPLLVAAHGGQRSDASKTVQYFMSKAGQQKWIATTGFTSARSDVPSASSIDQELDQTVQSGGYKLLNRYWEATPSAIVEVAVDEFAKFMLHPSDPTSILQAIQTKADSVWATTK